MAFEDKGKSVETPPDMQGGRIGPSSTVGWKRKRVPEPKFYSVRSGHCPGVYNTWAECLAQATGFKGANFRSFTTLTDAEKWLAGEDVKSPSKTKPSYTCYAVSVGREPGIYPDWESAQKQITGWPRSRQRGFFTQAEAQRWLNEEAKSAQGEAHGQQEADKDALLKKSKKGSNGSARTKHQSQSVKDNEPATYEPGLNLPPGAEDGFDPNIILGPGTGNVIIKTSSQKSATKLRAVGPAPASMLKVHTDGSALRNGQEGAFAGVGIYFGPSDPRNLSEPLPGNKQTNQRAELTAIIRALDTVPKYRDLIVATDSQYAINCVTLWYKAWQGNGWKTSYGKTVENKDLIESIRGRLSERERMGVETHFEWIKGHAGYPGNVEADKLAVSGAREAGRLAQPVDRL